MTASSSLSDDSLVGLAQQGDLEAFTVLYERYFPSVFNRVRFTIPEPDVEDLTQEVFIAVMKIVAGLAVPVTVALLLNEVRARPFKRAVQTIVYLPHFLSWVILGGIMIDILSPSTGIVNRALGVLGIEPVFFLGEARIFPYVLVVSDVTLALNPAAEKTTGPDHAVHRTWRALREGRQQPLEAAGAPTN